MKNIIGFIKKHWTWISGLLTVIANYSVPAVNAALTSELGAHAGFKVAFFAIVAFIAHVSPSPLSTKS